MLATPTLWRTFKSKDMRGDAFMPAKYVHQVLEREFKQEAPWTFTQSIFALALNPIPTNLRCLPESVKIARGRYTSAILLGSAQRDQDHPDLCLLKLWSSHQGSPSTDPPSPCRPQLQQSSQSYQAYTVYKIIPSNLGEIAVLLNSCKQT